MILVIDYVLFVSSLNIITLHYSLTLELWDPDRRMPVGFMVIAHVAPASEL